MSVSTRLLSRKLATELSASRRRDVFMKGLACYQYFRRLQTGTHDSSDQQREQFLQKVSKDELLRHSMAYSLSFAAESAEKNDFSSNMFVNGPDQCMQRQLANSENQLRRRSIMFDDSPLPRTLKDALRPSQQAIVITETTAPFRIVDVNTAWEGLCGYSFVECQGKTLGSLLQGPETDRSAVTAVVSTLLRGEQAGVVLTNYTKDGRPFRNRLRVGPLMDGDKTTHFIGVLQEIHDNVSPNKHLMKH